MITTDKRNVIVSQEEFNEEELLVAAAAAERLDKNLCFHVDNSKQFYKTETWLKDHYHGGYSGGVVKLGYINATNHDIRIKAPAGFPGFLTIKKTEVKITHEETWEQRGMMKVARRKTVVDNLPGENSDVIICSSLDAYELKCCFPYRNIAIASDITVIDGELVYTKITLI